MDTPQVDQPQEGVARITLNRPDRFNAMNATLIADLHDALADRTQVPSSMTGAMREAVAAFLEKRPPRYGSPARSGQ